VERIIFTGVRFCEFAAASCKANAKLKNAIFLFFDAE
jgi:hypothetical protein